MKAAIPPNPIVTRNSSFVIQSSIARLLLLVMPIAAGCYALWLGQDISWDLRNYHIYNPFAFLSGRMGHDVAVAHVATYYNPLMHLPFYWAVTALPPKVVGFLLGLVSGLNGWVLYGIARQAIYFERRTLTVWICLATAWVGLLGAMNLAEIGTSYGDNILSLPVLAAIWLVLRFRDRLADSLRSGWPIVATAGFLTGAVLGLKLPLAVYAVAFCAAFLGLNLPFQRRCMLAFIFGLGVLAGMALSGGFWMLEMWHRFRNPLFPYFNQYFQSPWGAIGSYRDERFIPTGWAQEGLFPIGFNLNPMQVGEVVFRDLRLPLLYLLLLVLLGQVLWRRLTRRKDAPAPANDSRSPLTAFFVILLVVAFVLWMKIFAIYRYAMICDFLAPLTIVLVLGALVRDPRRQMQFALIGMICLVATVQPGDWGRRAWTADYFDVHVPAIPDPQHTLILLAGHDPVAYMIPFFPPQVRFLRIQGYSTGPSPTPNETDRLMMRILAKQSGPILILYRSYEEWNALNALKFHNLKLAPTTSQRFVPGIEPQPEHPYYLCPVTHALLRL
jgi:hypothetical protein